jgi:hypothetical protein
MTNEKEDQKIPESLVELDYQIYCKSCGKEDALKIMMLANALHEASAIERGLKERRDS